MPTSEKIREEKNKRNWTCGLVIDSAKHKKN